MSNSLHVTIIMSSLVSFSISNCLVRTCATSSDKETLDSTAHNLTSCYHSHQPELHAFHSKGNKGQAFDKSPSQRYVRRCSESVAGLSNCTGHQAHEPCSSRQVVVKAESVVHMNQTWSASSWQPVQRRSERNRVMRQSLRSRHWYRHLDMVEKWLKNGPCTRNNAHESYDLHKP